MVRYGRQRPAAEEEKIRLDVVSLLFPEGGKLLSGEQEFVGELYVALAGDLEDRFDPICLPISAVRKSLRGSATRMTASGPRSSRYTKETTHYFNSFQVKDQELRRGKEHGEVGIILDDKLAEDRYAEFVKVYRKIRANYLRKAMEEDRGRLQQLLAVYAAVREGIDAKQFYRRNSAFNCTWKGYEPDERLQDRIEEGDEFLEFKQQVSVVKKVVDVGAELAWRRARNAANSRRFRRKAQRQT
ncbi:hypothetical protein HOD38_03605 [archaeon]|jgi:hypothetical protein|nr:hypothetical protein [archaeon]MBT4397326.1 hypothetical protein [archaeon]MBT4440706.1 hypothetical protein [archaeon]